MRWLPVAMTALLLIACSPEGGVPPPGPPRGRPTEQTTTVDARHVVYYHTWLRYCRETGRAPLGQDCRPPNPPPPGWSDDQAFEWLLLCTDGVRENDPFTC